MLDKCPSICYNDYRKRGKTPRKELTKMTKMICFDMDGTIADLYNVENWEAMLNAGNPIPYEVCAPMWDMERLADVLNELIAVGIEIRIVTWLAIGATEEYNQQVREAKRNWLEKFNFPFTHFHGVKYGTTKANCVRKYLDGEAILIDDNAKVRNGWTLGQTIDPTTCDIIAELEKILGN